MGITTKREGVRHSMQWNLIRVRKENDMSQQDVADVLGISLSAYQNKETSKSSFRDYEMFILGERFGKSIDEIFLPPNCTDNAIKVK